MPKRLKKMAASTRLIKEIRKNIQRLERLKDLEIFKTKLQSPLFTTAFRSSQITKYTSPI
jgi:hypothetical protein